MSEYAEDGELVRRCLRGQKAALDQLVRDHLRMVLAVSWRFTGERAAAEDLTQEILEKTIRGLPGFRGESRLRTWIYAIAVSHGINHVRRRREAAMEPDEVAALQDALKRSNSGADAPVLDRELTAQVHEAVNSLPDELREVVIRCEFEGEPQEKVAKALRIPVGTVWSRLNRAKAMLRPKLARYLRD